MKPLKSVLLSLLVLALSSPAIAEDSSPEIGICRQEHRQLGTMQQQLQDYRDRARRIQAVADGEAPATLSPDQLAALLAGNAGDSAPPKLPQTISCESLQQRWTETLEKLVWQQKNLERLRHTTWIDQPEVVRAGILSIWRSRQRLALSSAAIEPLLAGERASAVQASAALAALQNLHEELRAQRLTFFRLVPALADSVSPAQISQWLTLWRQALEQSRDFPEPEPGQLASLPADIRAALEEHYRVAHLDQLVMTNIISNVRGWLWRTHRQPFRAALASLQITWPGLLASEMHAIHTIFKWLYVDAQVDYEEPGHGGRAIVWRFFHGFEYLFGLLSFVLLALLAHRLKAPIARLQAVYARGHRRSRLHLQLSRITSAIPILTPWIVGWFGLQALEAGLVRYHLVLLIPLVPLARLYILYGLLHLSGEWLVQRVAQLASTWFNDQQLRQADARARACAGIFILPWLLKDLAVLALGPSLLLNLLDWATLLALYLALGLLFAPWRREFILGLQSFTPPVLDPWVERALSGFLFRPLAPLLVPLLLVALLLNFFHKSLVDFDWYRKLMARSFKLRSASQESEPAATSDCEALAHYRCWFGDSVEGESLPVISVELAEKIRACLTSWLNDRGEENSLLLTGERGAGKSTALRQLADWLAQQEQELLVQRLEVPAKTVAPEAVTALVGSALQIDLSNGPAELVKSDQERTPTVVILEDAQNFFLREYGGLAGWETLLNLTRARLSNVFWVIAINNQSWAYLSRVFGADYQFSMLVHTRPWSLNDIRSLVLSRNQLSGYRIQYDAILLSTRGPEAGSIRNAEQLYFSLLWDACRGNPMLALQMWLTSVTVKGKTVTVSLPEEVTTTSLEHLGPESHFVYAALVVHENMTTEELVAATSMPESVVRSALKSAFDIGFVERTPDRRYRIVPLWYPTITKLLARKNLLHE